MLNRKNRNSKNLGVCVWGGGGKASLKVGTCCILPLLFWDDHPSDLIDTPTLYVADYCTLKSELSIVHKRCHTMNCNASEETANVSYELGIQPSSYCKVVVHCLSKIELIAPIFIQCVHYPQLFFSGYSFSTKCHQQQPLGEGQNIV